MERETGLECVEDANRCDCSGNAEQDFADLRSISAAPIASNSGLAQVDCSNVVNGLDHAVATELAQTLAEWCAKSDLVILRRRLARLLSRIA